MSCFSFEKFLMGSDSLHVYEASKIIFTSSKSGLLPLLEYSTLHSKEPRGRDVPYGEIIIA